MEKVQSESDERTGNNAVRHEYRVLTDVEKEYMLAIKDKGAAFIQLLDHACQTPQGVQGSREISIAKTKIEEAVMWAVKHVTR